MDDLTKNNSVTMIEIVKVESDEQTKSIEGSILPEMDNIFDVDDDKYMAVEEIEGRDVMFLFVEQRKVDALTTLLRDNNLLHSARNVTEEILMGDLDDADFEKMMQSEEFKSIFDTFLLKNLDADKVLDKISYKGIDKLNDIDKIILENSSK